MDVNFACTKCGKCCKNHRVPLDVKEAVRWLADGNEVQVLCEAIPWPNELPPSNTQAAYRRTRSFEAVCGALPIRVLVTLVAPLGQQCPNLLADNSCGIYARRPKVCRIYPAELNPFATLTPAARICPPEAWGPDAKPLMVSGAYVDEALRAQIQDSLKQGVEDVRAKQAVCTALQIRLAGMANEGWVAHRPDQKRLLQALVAELVEPTADVAEQWAFVSDRPETIDAIKSSQARCWPATGLPGGAYEYLSRNG